MRKTSTGISFGQLLPVCYAVIGISFLTACHKTTAPVNSANVMFVNGCVSAGTVSAKANSVTVSGATNISFLMSSGYQYVTAGSEVNLTFFEGSTGTPLASRAENIAASGHYSVFAGGIAGAPDYLFTTDDLSSPASGNAKVRFVNLSPDNLNETATANDTIITQGISGNTASGFFQLRAGSYYLDAFDPLNRNAIVPADTVVFVAGRIYTVLLTGTGSGTLTTNLQLSLINNN